MKNKVFFLVALAVGMVFVMSGCKDCDDPSDPDCGNYDPCFGQEEFKPRFDILTGGSHPDGTEFLPRPLGNGLNNNIVFISDTSIFQGAFFRAGEGYDSVKWRVGQEAFFRTEKIFGLTFGSIQGEIPIRFYGYRTPNKMCFPNEKAIDTLQRNLILIHPDSSRVYGDWIGAYETEPQDSFEFTIHRPTLGKMRMINFPPNAHNGNLVSYGFLYDSFKGLNETEILLADHLSRCFYSIGTVGRVFGDRYQYLEISMEYSYEIDGILEREKRKVKFNARRK